MAKKIFIIEDDVALLYGLQAKFRVDGFETAIHNGTGAINTAMEQIKLALPSAIVLDLILPDIEGFELLKLIKTDKETNNIPIFIFTNYTDKAIKERCQNIGAEYYFVKSELNIDEFVAKVKKIINNLDKIKK
ncbi:response regulator transcription factor [Candidatus Parcubacteria bacterium]|nr:response regulator transcription factor [Candidatus Parcubacteria bacterium]